LNALDYLVLLGTLLGIAAYGMWATRGRVSASDYLKGRGNTPWLVIGLSVMATQASAVSGLLGGVGPGEKPDVFPPRPARRARGPAVDSR